MSTTVLDLCAAVRDLLEPDPIPPAEAEVAKDLAGAEPFTWDEKTLYVYPIANADTPIETGPTSRQDFALLAVYVAASAGEEPGMERIPEVSTELDTKRGAYMAAIRANRVTTTWHHIRGVERATAPRTLQSRAVAIEIRGFRIVS